MDSNSKLVRILTLEAALQSTAAKDRFEYLTSIERGDRPLEEFNVTKKRIVSKEILSLKLSHDNSIEFTDANNMLIDAKEDETKNGTINVNIGGDPKEHSGADVGIAAILSRLTKEPNERIEAELRKRFTQDGLLFEYRHGLDITEDSPILNSLDHAYKRIVSPNYVPAVNQTQQKKFVYISFEPTLSRENKRDGDDESNNFYLSETERVTLILLADDDPEKSTQELTAEREDLRLLISMIFQQKLRDRKREVALIDRRVQVINGFLDGFTHRIINEVSEISSEAIEIIKQQEEGLKRALRFDQASLEKMDSGPEPQNILANIWMSSWESIGTMPNLKRTSLYPT